MNDQVQEQKNLQALHDKSFNIKFELTDSSYKPIENIGTGAYGVVCSAVHILSNTKVNYYCFSC
jgi:mitogen-activated protein kinase 7